MNEEWLLIGGSRDGERLKVPSHQSYVVFAKYDMVKGPGVWVTNAQTGYEVYRKEILRVGDWGIEDHEEEPVRVMVVEGMTVEMAVRRAFNLYRPFNFEEMGGEDG